MSKRFTDTEKWQDPWFSELNPSDKLLWLYLVDRCNQIGVMDFSKRWADFAIGLDTDINSLVQGSAGRLKKLSSGKYILTRFCAYQYTTISEKCPAHKPIIKLLKDNVEVIEIIKNTLSDNLLNTLSSRVQEKETIINGIEKEEEKKETRKASTKLFSIPTLEEVTAYFDSKELPETLAKEFFEFQENKGWKYKSKPIENWHNSTRIWKTNFTKSNPQYKHGSRNSQFAKTTLKPTSMF